MVEWLSGLPATVLTVGIIVLAWFAQMLFGFFQSYLREKKDELKQNVTATMQLTISVTRLETQISKLNDALPDIFSRLTALEKRKK